MWDNIMLKAAYIHDRIMEQGKRPDVQTGALRFIIEQRVSGETYPIRLHYETLRNGRWATLMGMRRDHAHGAVHLTEATVTVADDLLTITTRSRCCPKDNPRRWIGRTIAMMRMAGVLGPLGYNVLAVWGRGNSEARTVIPADVQVPEGYAPENCARRRGSKGERRGRR